MALTAQEIVDSVVGELDNIADYQAAVDIGYDDVNVNDVSDQKLS